MNVIDTFCYVASIIQVSLKATRTHIYVFW